MTLNKEIDALIQLLDDPDDQVYSQIRDKIMSYGTHVIPVLENVWEHNSFGVLFQTRIENIIHSIQFDTVFEDLSEWGKSRSHELLEGMLLIARYQYPDMDMSKTIDAINQIKQDIWIELNDGLTAFEQIKVINHILFDIHAFSGNTSNYHAPQNSYISDVIETKKGNPISLSVLYSILAQQLELPIYGVNLPRHFILAYVDDIGLKAGIPLDEAKVLFYINPFSRGGIFSKREIDYFLKQLELEEEPKYYKPCDNLDIIRRVFNNLIHSYDKLGYPDKIEELQTLSKAIK